MFTCDMEISISLKVIRQRLAVVDSHLVPGHRLQYGELRALDVEAEQVHLVGDVGGQQQTVQWVALNTLSGPQLFWDTLSDLELGLF